MNKRTMFIILGVVLVIKFTLAFLLPLTPDESLHWMQGRNLAWGFKDHPPVTAFLSFLSRSVFGVSILNARFFAITLTTLCSLIAFGILRETGYSEESACRGAVVLQMMPMFALGFIMVPVFPFTALVFATEYLFIRALKRQRLTDHLLWGCFLGISALSYYIVVTAALAAAIFCVLDGRGRQCLCSLKFWAGVGIAAVVFAPNACWNLDQGSESAIYFQLFHRSPYEFKVGPFLAFMALALVAAGPVILNALGRSIKTFARWKSSTEEGMEVFFAIMFAVPLLGFLVLALFREVGAHWVVISFLNAPLVAVSRREPGSRWWLRAQIACVSFILLIPVVALTVGPLRILGRLDPSGERVSIRRRLLYFEAERTAHLVYETRRKLQREGLELSLLTDRWSTGGVFSFYDPGHPYYFVTPPPPRHGQDYGLWNKGYDVSGDILFIKGSHYSLTSTLQKACTNVETLSTIGPEERPAYVIYLCKGFDPARWWK